MRKHLFWIAPGALLLAFVLFMASHALMDRGAFRHASAQGKPGAAAHENKAGVPDVQPADIKDQPAALEVRNEQTPPNPLGYESKYGDLPKSLQGAQVPGDLRTDRYGDLMVTRGVREMFEFFMSGISEESRDVALGRIREYIRFKLDKKAALQADKILDDYIAYKDYLAGQHQYDRVQDPDVARDTQAFVSTIREVMYSRMDARRKFMGAKVADAFFKDDEAYDRYSLDKLEINADPGLSPQEKRSKMKKLDEQFRQSSHAGD